MKMKMIGAAFSVVIALMLPRLAFSQISSQQNDWMLRAVGSATNSMYTTSVTKAPSSQPTNSTTVSLSNGLIERTFLLLEGGGVCTIELMNLVSHQTYFRAISAEANATLSGKAYNFGGCLGEDPAHYEFWNSDEYLSQLKTDPAAFRLLNVTQSTPEKPFNWTSGNRFSPKGLVWPPHGVQLTFWYQPPSTASVQVLVAVHYEMYDGIPALRKWVSVHNTGTVATTVDTMVMELLRAPNFAPERMTVQKIQADNPTPFDQQVPPDRTMSFPGRDEQLWFSDPNYDQCCDREIHVTYTLYTFLVLGYATNTVYGGSTGPGSMLQPGDTFSSLSIRIIFHDSNNFERQGLAIRKVHSVLAPHLMENPLNYMVTDISTTAVWRTAIDQAQETGHNIVIVGFGAAGYCGLCPSQLNNASWVAWFKEQVEYAKSKRIEISAYTLMQHNGWGESTPESEQTLSRTGVRGPTACFATDFHANYRQAVLDFIQTVGMGGLETDGQYENIPCSDSTGDHHHNGIAGGFSYGIEAALDFNRKLKDLGTYQTGADAYFWSGANRWNHADTDAFGRLPLWEQHTVGRMYAYDSIMSRLQSSGQIGVNDLASTSRACTGSNGRTRMVCFDFILAGYYGWGVLAGFRSSKLFDPADPEAAQLLQSITAWTSFYRNFTKPRPSGAGGILLGDLIHVLRPSSRSLEAAMSVTSDTSAAERAILTVLNPTLETLSLNVTANLYYAGLTYGTHVRVAPLSVGWMNKDAADKTETTNGVSPDHIVGQDGGAAYDIVIGVTLKPSSYTVLLISTTPTSA